jgi:hypothetical protein
MLKGNAFGQQKVWLRSDKTFRTGIVVSLVNGQLLVDEVNNGKTKNLQKLALDKFDGIEPISVEQDKQAVVEKDLETLTRYAPNTEQAKLNLSRLQAEMQAQPKTIAEGAKPYKDTLSYHSRADRQLQISLKGDTLNIMLDNKPALENVKVSVRGAGGIGLQAVWGGYGWSQRNLADDVYDGIFEKLKITDVDDKAKILYDNSYTGWTRVRFELQKVWEKILNFALTYL